MSDLFVTKALEGDLGVTETLEGQMNITGVRYIERAEFIDSVEQAVEEIGLDYQAQINAEVQNRQNADANLQAQIDLKADKTDLVTKADKTDVEILNSEYATSLELETAEGGLGVNSIKGQTVKDSTGIHSAGSLGLVDMGTLEWGTTDESNTFIANISWSYQAPLVSSYIKGYTNVSSSYHNLLDKQFTYNVGSAPYQRIVMKNILYTSASDFKSAMNGVLLAYELQSGSVADKYALVVKEHNENNTKSNNIIIPLSAPINRNNGVYDEIVKQNGQWGVLRKFGYDDLETCSWSLINNEYWRTVSITDIKLSASWTAIPNILAEKYVTNGYTLPGIGVAPTEPMIKVNNNSTTEKPSGKFIYELATPYFEPFDDQSVMYQLMSYDTKTYVTTGEGLAELSVRYGKSDVAAESLLKYAPESVNVDLSTIESNISSLQASVGTLQTSVSSLQTSLGNKLDKSGGTISGDLSIVGHLTIGGHDALHTGNSARVIVSDTAPTDTSAIWIK